MARNIFLLEPAIEAEDRLTFAWTWIMTLVPELGQAFCDYVAEQCGLPRSKFESAVDHPPYTASDRPDMLLATRDWQVLFEHKLDAPMDTNQLERYLALAGSFPNTRLAFMSRDLAAMQPSVLNHPLYLKPRDRDQFLWTDIYPLVAACRSLAATDFEGYLAQLGLRPERWGGLGDPFVAARPLVMKVLADASEWLRRSGWPARNPDARKWDAIEIPNPLPNIHLGYLKLKKTMGRAEPRVSGRAVEMIVWTKGDGSERYLPRVLGRLDGSGAPILVRPDWKNRRMPPEYRGELYFTAAMKDVLGDSYGSAVDGVTSFAERVLTFVRDGGRVIEA